MGLRDEITSGQGAVFSEDILKVEVYGPHEDYLTIIDVPGIFRTTTQGTTKEDMAMVKDMVKSYIKNDRTIILAVLPANIDIATQEILELAEEYDPNGLRTLGVLTKPDLVIEPSAQAAVRKLVQGRNRPLNLGYYLVRNRGADGGLTEQAELDRIFRQQAWNDLPPDRMGIPALKEQLALLLVDISRRAFPELIREVSDQISSCKKKLDSLGPRRQGEREQRSFLSHIAGAFQDRARAALAADYSANSVFDGDELRLITQVVNITDAFCADFQLCAHSRKFEDMRMLEQDDEPKRYSEVGIDEGLEKILRREPAFLQTVDVDNVETLSPRELSELGDLVVVPRKVLLPSGNVTEFISDVYQRSRGRDIGTFNPNLISMAFAEQSRNWVPLTKVYMSRIIVALHRFIVAALRSVCLDEEARGQLWAAILESLVERYQKAVGQANLLMEVERRKPPYTLNRRFNQLRSEARGRRITELLRPKARKDTKQYGGVQDMVNLDDIAYAAEKKGNVKQLQDEIHDILESYYGIALERYLDNVFQLAVDYQLLYGPCSPLKLFTPEWVVDLEPNQLEAIAGETKAAKKRRNMLEKNFHDLSDAMKILKT